MMKKLLSVLVLGLTLLLTACGDQSVSKPGEQFVGIWKGSDNHSQYEIKRNGDSEDTFIVKIKGGNTFEGKLLDDTLTANYGAIQLTIDQSTGEMIFHGTALKFKRSE